jgi:hypothetical protein
LLTPPLARFPPPAAQAIRKLTSPGGTLSLVHNLDEQAMNSVLTALFEEADSAQSSSLPKQTVKHLLATSDIAFTPKEIQCLLSSADLDVDGAVMYHSLALGAHRQLGYLSVHSQ